MDYCLEIKDTHAYFHLNFIGCHGGIMYRFSKEESDRIRIVKFIGIILVVYFHAHTTEVNFGDGSSILALPVWLRLIEDGISYVIAGCSVPLFFLFSAVLLFRSQQRYGTVIRRKVRTLLVPYLIWNTFWVAVFVVLQSLPFTAAYFSGSNTPILQCSVKEWFGLYGIGRDYPQCYPLWFMRDLMGMILLSPVIKAVADRYPKIILCIGIMLTIFPIGFYGKTALAWFLTGAAIVKMEIHMTLLDKITMPKITAVYLLGAGLIILSENSVARNAFVITGILFFIRLSKEIYARERARKRILMLSQWTFMIYVLHELTLSSVRKVCLRILPGNPIMFLLEYLLIPVLVILFCIAGGGVLKRTMPGLYQIMTGER